MTNVKGYSTHVTSDNVVPPPLAVRHLRTDSTVLNQNQVNGDRTYYIILLLVWLRHESFSDGYVGNM